MFLTGGFWMALGVINQINTMTDRGLKLKHMHKETLDIKSCKLNGMSAKNIHIVFVFGNGYSYCFGLC